MEEEGDQEEEEGGEVEEKEGSTEDEVDDDDDNDDDDDDDDGVDEGEKKQRPRVERQESRARRARGAKKPQTRLRKGVTIPSPRCLFFPKVGQHLSEITCLKSRGLILSSTETQLDNSESCMTKLRNSHF